MKIDRSIRLSQGITTSGIGAIVGIGDESFINMSMDKWRPSYKVKEIKLQRLAKRLNVQSFKHPQADERFHGGGKFTFDRFPKNLFCQKCRKITKLNWDDENKFEDLPRCTNPTCKESKLIPMRFITVCENGHIDEFPWHFWAHKDTETKCKIYNELYFRTNSGQGASYASLKIECKACGASNTLAGADIKNALQGIKCKGRQPWQSKERSIDCSAIPQMQQRNASNIYQPSIVSAIDIPSNNEDTTNDLFPILDDHPAIPYIKMLYERDKNINDVALKYGINNLIENLSESKIKCTFEDVFSYLRKDDVEEDNTVEVNETDFDLTQNIKIEEWPSFFKNHSDAKFINYIEKLPTNNNIEHEISNLINHVSLVKKLREVRAFTGFNRLEFNFNKRVSATFGVNSTSLPGIEVFGEGIFISLNPDNIDSWYEENKLILSSRFKRIKTRYNEKSLTDKFGKFSPKFILLHTLAHLLIRQLSFESGYNSSSLRENIYCSELNDKKMYGILIYTADSDSEGSLGGLVRQGESERLLPTLITSLQRAIWCSADPVCQESEGQGEDGLNMAACHACSLIAETSCMYFNSLLDRSLIIDKEFGFFKNLIKILENK